MSVVLLEHGGGGRLARELIEAEILPRFSDLQGLPDAASLWADGRALRFAADSFVVQPLEFPGGNIGHLAVHGTVNDLAVAGGRPRWLSLAMIVEEGLPLATLRRVLDAVRDAAVDCGVAVVTGDTKVVPRGQCDGLYLSTAGIAEALPELILGANRVQEGDAVLVSGPLGDHGMAVLCAREGFDLDTAPSSDTGPVHGLVASIAPLGPSIRFLRDPTRGGLAGVLDELARDASLAFELDEAALPFAPATRSVAELLGLELLHVACEGRVMAVCAPDAADALLSRWRSLPEGAQAARVGTARPGPARLILRTRMGGRRLIDPPRGELLPRIC